MVTIIELPKEGKAIQREETISIGLAEKVLTKKKGWTLPKDSDYQLKDDKLVKKPVKKSGKKQD